MRHFAVAALSVISLFSTAQLNAGELGDRAFCKHKIENAQITLASEKVTDQGIGYSLKFEVAGQSRGIKSVFGKFLGKASPSKIREIKDQSIVGNLTNYLDSIELSGGTVADDWNHAYQLVRRGDDIVLAWGKNKSIPWDLTEAPGNDELVVGQVDPETLEVDFTEDRLEIRYVETGYNEVFFNPVYTIEGAYIEFSMGFPEWFGNRETGEGCE